MTQASPLRWIRKSIFRAKQEDMAAIGAVSRPSLSRYETGKEQPPFRFLQRVRAEARRRGLDFSAEWFFDPPAADGEPRSPAWIVANPLSGEAIGEPDWIDAFLGEDVP